jgi:hypothetical protein
MSSSITSSSSRSSTCMVACHHPDADVSSAAPCHICTPNCALLAVLERSCKVSAFFESHNGKRMPLRGEGGEYSLEVVRHDPDNRGESAVNCTSCLIVLARHAAAGRVWPSIALRWRDRTQTTGVSQQ